MGRPATRRTTTTFRLAPDDNDPLTKVIKKEEAKDATSLQAALDALGEVGHAKVKIIVYQVNKQGRWGYIKETFPPVDMAELMEELRNEYGHGTYAARVFVDGVMRSSTQFDIAPPKGAIIQQQQPAIPQTDLVKLLLEQANSGKSDQTNMFMMMMKMSADSAQQMMQMQQNQTQMMVGLMTAIMGNRDDPTKTLIGLAEMFKTMQPPPADLKAQLETVTMLRDLTTKEGDGDDSLMGMAKAFMPALGAMGQAAMAGIAAKPTEGQAPEGPQIETVRPTPLPRHMPPAVADGPVQAGSAAGANSAPPGPALGATPHPILMLIRDDVTYFMRRGHDPILAADAIGDILEANNVGQEQLFAFAMELHALGDKWPEKFLHQGIDISQHVQWVEQVLAELAVRFGDDPESGGDSDGADGGAPDAPDHEEPRPERVTGRNNKKQGSTVNQ